MVTFLVLNIVMIIVTGGASVIVTIFVANWDGSAVDSTDCVTVDNSCTCLIYNTSSEARYEVFDGMFLLNLKSVQDTVKTHE